MTEEQVVAKFGYSPSRSKIKAILSHDLHILELIAVDGARLRMLEIEGLTPIA